MEKSSKNESFGDFSQYKRARKELFSLGGKILDFPSEREYERNFLLAVIRRTLSLETAFIQSVDACNGQMAMTLVRLNLDTLARLYALYWADETDGMTAETFAKEVAEGKSIKDMKFRGAKEKASDRWLIKQIEGLGEWIPVVYTKTSGAIHFSDFHINQLLQQVKPIRRLGDGSLHAEIWIGSSEQNAEPELYWELQQCFLHISLMLIDGIQYRCKPALD